MFQKRIAEIEARKAEILKEIEGADEARTAELDTEVNGLNDELTQLRSKQAVADKLGDHAPKPGEGEQRGAALSDLEVRAKQLRETRAVTIASGKLVKPVKTDGINDAHPEVSSIVDQVDAADCEGMGEFQVAYVISSGEGKDTAEGAEVEETEPEFGMATIKPGTITTYAEVSREVLKLNDQDYLQVVENAAKTALRRKLGKKIVGTGTDANFTSIFKAEACETDVEVDVINEKTLRNIAMNYGGEEAIAGNAVLYLNKKDLLAFGDVRGTNEKKHVYEITPDTANPNTGIIKDGGLAVRYCLNSGLVDLASQTAGGYCMAYGNPKAYQLGMFSDYKVIVDESVALKRRMIAILGEVMVGGNVVVHDGFIRVKKKA